MLSCLIVLVLAATPVTATPAPTVGTVEVDAELDAVPQRMNLQGYLTTTGGEPVNDTLQMVFRIWRGGSAVWTETQNNRIVHNGLFSVGLGSVTPIPFSVFEPGTPCSLEVAVAGTTLPKVEITSVGFAYRSVKSDTAVYSLSAAPSGPAGGDLAGSYPNPAIAQKGATTGQVLKWTGSSWQPRNDSVGGGTGGDNAWVRGTPDSVLFTIRPLGIASAGNVLYGAQRHTHVNFGTYCTTGLSGSDHSYATIGGGEYNVASRSRTTVGGGARNRAAAAYATISGGYRNVASNSYATVGGGNQNIASTEEATVAGGDENVASGRRSAVGGGHQNTAEGDNSTVAGGYLNRASGLRSTVGGGFWNLASHDYATVPGGYRDTAAARYSFAANHRSIVPDDNDNSAAFNGQTATGGNQTRVGTLSKAGGSFTIDHPVDPYGKILNHYFIEGPEMRNLYDGEVVLDASGRAVVLLPDYFGALNRNPRVQLTGVGSSDVVYLAEKVTGNRFVIAGKPGMEVYWQVTGERSDVSAEAIRRMMPVEQPKRGALAGRMLDDEFVAGCMVQLVREGKAEGIFFRTAAGQERYEQMIRPNAATEEK